MSQATPRKFSEKIAILERKQNEEQEQFNSVMRDVRTITSTDQPQQQPTPQPSPVQQQQHYGAPPSNDSSCGSKLSPEGPHPLTANWNRAGGSLPNVHQMVQQPMGSSGSGGAAYGGGWSPSWTNVPAATSAGGQGQQIPQQHVRTRSPGAPHFHPYRGGAPAGGGRHDQQRLSQGETTSRGASMAGVHLQPPDPSWSKARSDPAIHTASMMTAMDPSGFMSAYPLYPNGGGQSPGLASQWPTPDAKMFNGPATAPTSAAIMPPTMPMAFFPTYPLGLAQQQPQPISPILQMSTSPSTLPPPNNQQPQSQSTAQQMFTPPQQLGSPSSSSTAINQQQFMGNNNEMAGMGAMNMQNNQQQQGRMAVSANFTNFQQQQMMQNCMQNNTAAGGVICRTSYQSSPQHFAAGGYHPIAAPPMYPTGPGMMKMQQQPQTMMMNPNGNGIVQQNGGNILSHHHQQQLAPSMMVIGQSQSAPTSPSSTSAVQCSSHMDGSNPQQHPLITARQQQQWPPQLPNRHFSASPDGMEVPNICVTGTDGSLDVDCFQDLQDLHLDNETLQMLKDPAANEQVDPACETQLLS